jgi:hypothetical protein
VQAFAAPPKLQNYLDLFGDRSLDSTASGPMSYSCALSGIDPYVDGSPSASSYEYGQCHSYTHLVVRHILARTPTALGLMLGYHSPMSIHRDIVGTAVSSLAYTLIASRQCDDCLIPTSPSLRRREYWMHRAMVVTRSDRCYPLPSDAFSRGSLLTWVLGISITGFLCWIDITTPVRRSST